MNVNLSLPWGYMGNCRKYNFLLEVRTQIRVQNELQQIQKELHLISRWSKAISSELLSLEKYKRIKKEYLLSDKKS